MSETRADATPYPSVNAVLDLLLAQIQAILGDKLVGLYLYGSLVTGDFDLAASDIDLLAATASDIAEQEFARLQHMHDDFARHHQEWDERIEVAYLSAAALKTFRQHLSKIAVISPGEPFHFKEAGSDWLLNWYIVRERGIALYGPSPKLLIDPISKTEYIRSVQAYANEWRERIEHARRRGQQAYAILTLCRACYAVTNGEFASKKQAAAWAEREWPEWSSLIRQALAWRAASRDVDVEHDATLPQTRRFVRFAVNQCEITPATAQPDPPTAATDGGM